jgi:3-oxoacyl-[acyl-carrier protein] reductase
VVGEELLDDVLSVNVRGVVLATQEAAKRLPAGGRIVPISSSTVQAPTEGMALYAGSKAAADVFTGVWAKELGPRGITVNSVAQRQAVRSASIVAVSTRPETARATSRSEVTKESAWSCVRATNSAS